MNGARLGIAAQSVGLSQAAYDEALAYAKDRKQFGKAIIEFPAVYDMLATIKLNWMQAVRCCIRLLVTWISTKHWMTLPVNASYSGRTSGTETLCKTG